MPIVDAGFLDDQGRPDLGNLYQYGPTLQVTVGHLPSEDLKPETEPESVYALVDTGACQSCIDIGVAQRLGLPVVDVQTISGANGAAQHDVFMARIIIPDLGFSQYGRFTGVKLADGGQAHLVLLGRTFLENVIMIYDGLKGQVTITSKF